MKVSVIGLGKIGLPVAVAIAEGGHHVTGVDTSESRRAEITSGLAEEAEPSLKARLHSVLATGHFAVDGTLRMVSSADVVLILVPVGLDRAHSTDLDGLSSLAAEIGSRLRPGTLVIVESTVPVGTTRRLLAPALENSSGLRVGPDFHLAFSPERVSSGSVFADLRRYPKIVGGVDRASGVAARSFYMSFLNFDRRDDLGMPNGVWLVTDSDAAEFTKLIETTYRDVNIGLANEFARFADHWGIDVFEAIRAANSQPFSHVHVPGASVGGHCIPVYPHMYLDGDQEAELPRIARSVNTDMPRYVVRQLLELHGPLTGDRVAVLGLTYRPGVREVANSGAVVIAQELSSQGATVFGHDPLLDDAAIRELGLTPLGSIRNVQAVVLHTAHDDYKSLTAADFPGVKTVIDGRNSLNPEHWAGTRFKTIGRPHRLGSLGVHRS